MKRNILIINANSVYSNNATGITLRSILNNIDSEKCMEIAWYGIINNKSGEISTIIPHYNKLSISNILIRGKRSSLNKSIKSSSIKNQKSSVIKRCLSMVRQYLALVPDQTRVFLSTEDERKIKAFSPDVIYTLGGSVNALRLSYELSCKYGIPVIIHHMDNWLHCIQWENNPLLFRYKHRLRKYCKKCYSRTNKCIAISEKMAEDFTNETKVPHIAIMNSIDCNKYRCENEIRYPFRFIYAGGMHLCRDKSLKDFAEAIESYNSNNKRKAEFCIYTGNDNIALFGDLFKKYSATKLIPAVPHEDIKDVYMQANALLHVESSTVLNSEFFKYSISTKIPEYLSTGKPVVFYGPNTLYLYQFLQDNNISYVINDRNRLEKLISEIINETSGNLEIQENGIQYAKEHFDINKAIKDFENVVDTVELP